MFRKKEILQMQQEQIKLLTEMLEKEIKTNKDFRERIEKKLFPRTMGGNK